MNYSTSTSFVNQIYAMNSKAVSLLLEGNHEVSYFTLQKALEDYRDGLNQFDAAMDEGDMDVDSTVLYSVAIHLQDATVQHKSIYTADSSSSCSSSAAASFPACTSESGYANTEGIFNRAFVLHQEEEDDCASPQDLEHTVPAVLLYNMGLCHHLQGMSTSLNQSARLRKAMQLYAMAHNMLEQASDALNDMDILVLLALSNNMGVLQGAQFCNRMGAQTCCQTMERILASQDCLEVLDDDDLEFFSTNLMFLSEFQQHGVAAAA